MRCLFGAVLVGSLLASGAQLMAASALSVGVTGNPRDGLAIGSAWNYDSEQEAAKAAQSRCSEFKTAPRAAAQCKPIGTVAKGCVVVAFDPKDDSPGMGWAVAASRNEAVQSAMAKCQAAAPPDRKDKCAASVVHCDGDPGTKPQ